jgi:hypothetical protein
VTEAEDAAAGRMPWWREIVYIVAFYAVYSFIRNTGAASNSARRAFTNAERMIDIEQAVGLYFEERLQDVFLDTRWFIQFWNVFYGSFHFVVTAFALIWCFRRAPQRYAMWRNTLALTTALALIGFAFFPLMPPRLLPASYGYVDTLAEIGGLWSFDSGTMKSISNQYAAMPSLHFGWAVWSALVLWPAASRASRPLVGRMLLVLYPMATLFAIVVTANHFWIDAAGGALVLAAGYGVARAITPRLAARARARSSASTVAPAS